MKRTSAALGSVVFLLVTPGTVCGLVPLAITGWRRPDDPVPWVDAVAWVLVVAGAAVLGHAFVAFAWRGRGTPSPTAPTERLVVEGAYRYVRNPMYVAVLAVVSGQALLFASWGLLVYLVVLALTIGVFVRTYEEPTLREAYGETYEEFCRGVPRWLPRPTPWRGSARSPGDGVATPQAGRAGRGRRGR